jgi:hypothetical protein
LEETALELYKDQLIETEMQDGGNGGGQMTDGQKLLEISVGAVLIWLFVSGALVCWGAWRKRVADGMVRQRATQHITTPPRGRPRRPDHDLPIRQP